MYLSGKTWLSTALRSRKKSKCTINSESRLLPGSLSFCSVILKVSFCELHMGLRGLESLGQNEFLHLDGLQSNRGNGINVKLATNKGVEG